MRNQSKMKEKRGLKHGQATRITTKIVKYRLECAARFEVCRAVPRTIEQIIKTNEFSQSCWLSEMDNVYENKEQNGRYLNGESECYACRHVF